MSRIYHKTRQLTLSKKSSSLTSDELLLQPWFLSMAVQTKMTALVPPSYRQKMRDFYDDYGCMVCGGHLRYQANGMCCVCNNVVRYKLKLSANRRLKPRMAKRVHVKMLSQAKLAKDLLAKYRSVSVTGTKAHRPHGTLENPVDYAVGQTLRQIPPAGRLF
jgi:hypothetical protein